MNLYFLLKSSEDLWFPADFRWNQSQLIRLNSLNMRSKICRQPLGGKISYKITSEKRAQFLLHSRNTQGNCFHTKIPVLNLFAPISRTYFLQRKLAPPPFSHHFKMPSKMLQRSFCSTLNNVMRTFR